MAIPYSRTIIGALPWYSALMVGGIVVAIWLLSKEANRQGLPRDTAVDVALVAVPCGIVGARLYYVAMSWETFAANPISALYIWEGGVALYGGVIGGALGVLVYARRKKIPFLQLADCAAPGLLLAQAIGRWGNYFNMEAYGDVITNPALQFFPLGVLISEGGGQVWHMATFFYESLWNLLGFIALWLMRKRSKEHGDTFMWYLLIYGNGRFIIEQLRLDSLYLGGFRVSQYLSLALCVLSACVLIYRAHRGERAHMLLCAAAVPLLAARWFALSSAWLYAALMLAAAALNCVSLLRRNRRVAPVALLPLAIDAIGLCLLLAGLPSPSLGLRLHTLLCSVTLPLYVYTAVHQPENT